MDNKGLTVHTHTLLAAVMWVPTGPVTFEYCREIAGTSIPRARGRLRSSFTKSMQFEVQTRARLKKRLARRISSTYWQRTLRRSCPAGFEA
jgi:hypothetical protein